MASTAAAQDSGQTPLSPSPLSPAVGEPGFIAKARGAIDKLHQHGIYPEVDTIVSSSGLAFGGTYRTRPIGDTGLSAEAGLMWSVRNYRQFTGRVGRLGAMRHTLSLDPAGTEVTSATNVHATKTKGTALYLEARHFNYRQVEYFGIDPAVEGPRADYALVGRTIDVVGQWQPLRRFGVSSRWGVLEVSPEPGSNSSLPDVSEAYSDASAPGLSEKPKYMTAGVGAAWDSRNLSKTPTRGLFVAGTIWRFNARSSSAQSFTRFTGDVRAFLPLSSDGRRVLAAYFIASADRTPGSRPVPFYLQGWLGGAHTLRHFHSYRLRGESVISGSVEHRWQVHRFVEVVPFFDLGVVSSTGRSLADGPLYKAAGAGVRFRTDNHIWMRIEWAYGDDGRRLMFAWSPSF